MLEACSVVTVWQCLPHIPAATYEGGSWWPVLETPNGPPIRLTRAGHYTTHRAAYQAALQVAKEMREAAEEVLAGYVPITLIHPCTQPQPVVA
jgi:hypothetical protein